MEAAQKGKHMMVIYRDEIGGAYYSGIPVALSRELLVIQKENDFLLDGYVAMRLGDVTDAERYDDNDFCRKIFKNEGVYDRAAAPGVSAENFEKLLINVKNKFGGWIAAECESREETIYYVGKIIKVADGMLTMRRIDADGTWHEEESLLSLDEITLVSFGDRYLSVFAKYAAPVK